MHVGQSTTTIYACMSTSSNQALYLILKKTSSIFIFFKYFLVKRIKLQYLVYKI
jgi:hypothetical protein